jgi:hypothetical protein
MKPTALTKPLRISHTKAFPDALETAQGMHRAKIAQYCTESVLSATTGRNECQRWQEVQQKMRRTDFD